MARALYVRGDGCILALVENTRSFRVHVAWSAEEAARWWDDFEHDRVPESVGQAISEQGMHMLVGSGRPGDSGEVEGRQTEPSEKPGFSGEREQPNPSAPTEPDDQRYHLEQFGDGWLEDDPSEDPADYYALGPLGMRFIACMHPVTGFRAFLNVWDFLDKDTGIHRILGACLWPGQEVVVQTVSRHKRVYELKARQLGETTIAVAYDAYVMRFRGHGNTRVHLISRTEDLAKTSLLSPMRYGLRHLPQEMLLPENTDTTTVMEYDAGEGDRRIAVAYSAKEPGRGETASHTHLDEWAAMAETSPDLPETVWGAVEPAIAKPDGTVHILTTGVGPVGFYADMWVNCISHQDSDPPLYPCFIRATDSRPDYTADWLAKKKRDMNDEARFAHEYPDRWEDALAGAGAVYFPSALCDEANIDARRQAPAGIYTDPRTGKTRRRKYVKAWDIAGPGERSDAVVCTVLDVTEPIWDIAHFERHKGEDYPITARRIEEVHRAFPGPTYIEDNAAGKAVRSFLKIPEDECLGHTTTRQSKPACLAETKLALQEQALKWCREECPNLDAEMRVYKLEDEALVQDCVMSLSIAVHYGPEAAADTGVRVLPFKSYTI